MKIVESKARKQIPLVAKSGWKCKSSTENGLSDILPTLILGIECDGAYKHLRRPQMRSPSASNSRELAFLDRHLSRYETPDSTPLPDSFLSRQSIGTIFSNPRLRITLPLA